MSYEREMFQWENVIVPVEKRAKIVNPDVDDSENYEADDDTSIETPNVRFDAEMMSTASDSLSDFSALWEEPIDVSLADDESEMSISEATYSTPEVDLSLIIDSSSISNEISHHFLSLLTVSPLMMEPTASPRAFFGASDVPMMSPPSMDRFTNIFDGMNGNADDMDIDPLLVSPPIDEHEFMLSDEENSIEVPIQGQFMYSLLPEHPSDESETEWSDDDWSDDEMLQFNYTNIADNQFGTSDDDSSFNNIIAVSGVFESENEKKNDDSGEDTVDEIDDPIWDEE